MLDNGLSLSIPAPADGTAITLTATVTDPAGNTASEAPDSAVLSIGPRQRHHYRRCQQRWLHQ
ncbi:hypothetical protein [Grimontia sp. NTOU-MAR1]|uniref:hypothetical protein n=1 Tax=Grimontia sp. NTOU-MAR1 TaxID=3111011 RepID=UPI002DBE72E5|nr:hypothetical protein [Grimontia sp. NTOU-MAR1]WRV96240.1 hypothetical protein VP504_00035 [Grimontia sp. NTOU-MAR1]